MQVTSTLRPGLCSVTLRSHTTDEVIDLARAAELGAVEWGGDVHAPPGKLGTAREISSRTLDAGLFVAAYGSYLRLGVGSGSDTDVLTTAVALGAPRVRVWAGTAGSHESDLNQRRAVAEHARALAAPAADLGLTIGLEFHGGTLTDTVDSTLALLADIDRPEVVGTYWQPPQSMDDASALDGLRRVLPWTVAVHAFSWWPGDTRLPLDHRRPFWESALAILDDGVGRDVLLEFVRDDDPGQVRADAASLRRWLERGRPH